MVEKGVPKEIVEQLNLRNLSVANLLSAIKLAKYNGDQRDMVMTIFTDSVDMYMTRLTEYNEEFGPFTRDDASTHLVAI